MGQLVTVRGDPAIDVGGEPADAGDAERRACGPEPPDGTEKRGPGIHAAEDTAIGKLNFHLTAQFGLGNAEASGGTRRLQGLKSDAAAFEEPAMPGHAGLAKAALGIVKHAAVVGDG